MNQISNMTGEALQYQKELDNLRFIEEQVDIASYELNRRGEEKVNAKKRAILAIRTDVVPVDEVEERMASLLRRLDRLSRQWDETRRKIDRAYFSSTERKLEEARSTIEAVYSGVKRELVNLCESLNIQNVPYVYTIGHNGNGLLEIIEPFILAYRLREVVAATSIPNSVIKNIKVEYVREFKSGILKTFLSLEEIQTRIQKEINKATN